MEVAVLVFEFLIFLLWFWSSANATLISGHFSKSLLLLSCHLPRTVSQYKNTTVTVTTTCDVLDLSTLPHVTKCVKKDQYTYFGWSYDPYLIDGVTHL